MYLRVTRRQNKDGSTVEYYQLAHNYRHPETRRSTAKVLYNFGRADQLDREELIRLCRSIARVCDLEVRELIEQELLQATLPEGLRLLQIRRLGCVYVAQALWERLGLGRVLRALAKKEGLEVPYEKALLAMVANRLCEPESKLGVWERWLSRVYLPDCQGLKLAQMYEAMDLLHRHAAAVEEAVFFQVADLFNLEVDVIFYDTTTVSFAIDFADGEVTEDEEGLRRRGRAKEGGWPAQVVVALAVTREGLPVRSWVFPGNTADVTTIERIKADLKDWKLHRALFVADSGLNSEDNRAELARACGKYLLAARMGSVAEIKDDVLTRPGRYKKLADNLKAKEVVVGEGERRRRYILCYNAREAKRQAKHRDEIVRFLEQELPRHPSRKATQKWAIELLASRRYGRYLAVRRGHVAIDRGAVREAKKYDGKWVIQTNDDTLSVEDAAQGYKNLMVIERCFRALKRTQIKISPVHHWLPRRIEAHVKICVLALLIERVAELACEKPWLRIREALSDLYAVELGTESRHFWQRSELSRRASTVLRGLDISSPKAILGVSDPPSEV